MDRDSRSLLKASLRWKTIPHPAEFREGSRACAPDQAVLTHSLNSFMLERSSSVGRFDGEQPIDSRIETLILAIAAFALEQDEGRAAANVS